MQTLSQSPRDDAFIQDPNPFYQKARAAGPLFYWSEYEMPCAAGFKTVDKIFRDRRFGREAPLCAKAPIPEHLSAFYQNEQNSMLEREPPNHTRLRAQVMREFSGRTIRGLEPEITRVAHTLIDQFPDGEFDLLKQFAELLPVTIIARMLGVPHGIERQLLDWSHAMVAMYQARRDRSVEDAAVTATLEFSDYIKTLISARRDQPQVDMISALVGAGEDAILNEEEIVSTIILLLNAGHEATVHTIGNGVACLLQQGTDLEMAFSNDQAIVNTTNEILRFCAPLHMFTRYALEDVLVEGHQFSEGDQIGLLLAAANRDSDHLEFSENFDCQRKPAAHTSFGAGIHFCVGAPLARAELNIAMPTLFKRCPNLMLGETPRFADRYHFHGYEKLIVKV